MGFIVRSASISDFSGLYEIGRGMPELKVSAQEDFMSVDEFKWSMTNSQGVFLVAEEEQKIIGFIYANAKDLERPFENRYACLVYLDVLPESRRKGVATKLYSECVKRLKKLGITHIYGWANTEGNGEITKFLEKQEFAKGHKYVWMDKKL